MPVNSYSLITVDDLRSYIDLGDDEIQSKNAIALYSSDGSAATVTVASNVMTLTKTGGTGTGHSIDLTDSDYETLTKLSTHINSQTGWTCRLIGWADATSTDIVDMIATNCLEAGHEVTLTYDDYFIIERLIDRASGFIEKFLKRNIKSRAYTHERYDGGEDELHLKNFPVTAIERISDGTLDAIKIKYTSSTVYNAYAKVSTTGVTLVVDGTGGSELTFAVYTTLTAMAAAINGEGNWEASVASSDMNSWPSSLLYTQYNVYALEGYGYLLVPDEPLTDYKVDSNAGIVYFGSRLNPGFQNVFATYTGGFSTVPDCLIDGCAQLVAGKHNLRKLDTNLKTEKKADYSYTMKDLKEMVSPATLKEITLFRRFSLRGD